jgi:hypothetical protein
MSNRGTTDMSAAVLGTTSNGIRGPPARKYGAGVVEAADERLKEEFEARHGTTAQDDASKPSGPEEELRAELRRANEKIAKARYHREALEKILEEAESAEDVAIRARDRLKETLANIRKKNSEKTDKQKRREAALSQKKADTGAKPVGIRKEVNMKKALAKK